MSSSPYTSLSGGPPGGYPNEGQHTAAPENQPANQATMMGVPAPPGGQGQPSPTAGGAPGRLQGDPYVATQPVKQGMVDQLANHVNQFGSKAENATRNLWSHFTGGPSMAHTAVGKLQNLKLITPGTAEKFWRETFCPPPGEIFLNYFSCHLSTTTGPVVGTLFASNASVAFISDRPLEYAQGQGVAASYYKVHIPLDRVATVKQTHHQLRPQEKCLQLITVDSHQFWLMHFLSYEKAVETIQGALRGAHQDLQARFQGAEGAGAGHTPQEAPVPSPGQPAQGIPAQGRAVLQPQQ